MTNPDLEQLVEVLAIKLSKLGYNAFDRDLRQVAQAILDAGFINAVKIFDGEVFRLMRCDDLGKVHDLLPKEGRHIQVFVRDVKELE